MSKNAANFPCCLLVTAALAAAFVAVAVSPLMAAPPKARPAAPKATAKSPVSRRPAADLTAAATKGDLRHVKVLFELSGTLALKSETSKPVKLPVQAKAHLVYAEKVLEGAAEGTPWERNCVRSYETAKATVKFRDSVVSPTLRDDRSLVGFSAPSADGAAIFSPFGPLTRDELDLLNVPGNSALVGTLLPGNRVSVGDSWELESDILAALLGMDVLRDQDIKCKFNELKGTTAVVEGKGTAEGATGGVDTSIEVSFRLNFHTERKCVTWFAMSLKEKRAMGHAQPGLEGTARVQMTLEPRTQSASLHPDILADLGLQADETNQLLEMTSREGGFEMLISRDWHEMVNRADVTILRMVQQGDLVAQCNITALPPMEDGVPFTLADFQQDIQNVLDVSFGEFVTATEAVNDNGLHVMQVVATGMASDVPITWVYYHVTNEQGRRISCVFTHDSTLVDRFGGADQTVISSLHFRERL